jgi:hypothetical protein
LLAEAVGEPRGVRGDEFGDYGVLRAGVGTAEEQENGDE